LPKGPAAHVANEVPWRRIARVSHLDSTDAAGANCGCRRASSKTWRSSLRDTPNRRQCKVLVGRSRPNWSPAYQQGGTIARTKAMGGRLPLE
jgi:hypothetical protein